MVDELLISVNVVTDYNPGRPKHGEEHKMNACSPIIHRSGNRYPSCLLLLSCAFSLSFFAACSFPAQRSWVWIHIQCKAQTLDRYCYTA